MKSEDALFERIDARTQEDHRRSRLLAWQIAIPVAIALAATVLFNRLCIAKPNVGSYLVGFLMVLVLTARVSLHDGHLRNRVYFWQIALPVAVALGASLAINRLIVVHPNPDSYFLAFMAGLTPAFLVAPRCASLGKRSCEAERTGGPSR